MYFANSDQAVASQIDRWSWFVEFAIPIESENFALVAAAAEQVAARLIESVPKAEIDQESANQIV